MDLFNWSFNFLQDVSGKFYYVPVVFAFCDLIAQTFFRIAFSGRLRVKFRTRLIDRG